MVIPDAGHAPNLDKPSLFNAEVRAFLDQVAAARDGMTEQTVVELA